MRNITLFGLLLILINPLYAADGSITFKGKIIAQTCTINSGSRENINIDLPNVSEKTLKASGATPTTFVIHLTACTAGNKAKTYFEPGLTVDSISGRLNNQATLNAARNVQVQILNNNNQPISITQQNQLNRDSQQISVDRLGNATMRYAAQYYANGASTEGMVATSVHYMVNYQ